MPAYPTITPPGSLDAALAPIAELSDVEFGHLVLATSSARSFSVSAKALDDLKSKIPTISNNLPFLLGALSFLYAQIDDIRKVGDNFENIIAKLVDELEFENEDSERKKVFQTRLEVLLKKNPSYARFEKFQRLQDGFVPNATSFRTMVDLRPDFGDGDTISYQGLLKIIQFRVMTDSINPGQKELIFQLTEESLADLSKAVERAQRKLEALSSEEKLSGQFIEIDNGR